MKILLVSMVSLFSLISLAQEKPEEAFDFWLGKWEAKWYNPDSSIVYGSNTITKILDSSVIEENFLSPTQKYKGRSLSIFNQTKRTWHQAYVDNFGNYYDFIGLFEENKKIFSTDTSKQIIQRMVFYNLSEESFTWDWEKSTDNGKTYQLSWRINYTRID